MTELDDIWTSMLASAAENPTAVDRDVADFLALKASNDQIRQAAVKWLFDGLTQIAAEANRRKLPVSVENAESHRFDYRGANIVGSLLRLRRGVRSLSLEAGWTRSPGDGFMRGGAMAVARISHFGIKEAGADLILIRHESVPIWCSIDRQETRIEFRLHDLMKHFAIFIGE
ncbi:MAG TPA: hypothetical protein VHL50_09160 [Pyrinomonadaceae bacterium]|nr:hypothetical protein [Pyrinomonadaceae bacterium]